MYLIIYEHLISQFFHVLALLGDYDAIHVRQGEKIKTRKDRFGVDRSLHPHLDRDTHPLFILRRIEKWVPPGRKLFIASNEKTPGYFFTSFCQKSGSTWSLINCLMCLGFNLFFCFLFRGFLWGSYGLTWALKNQSRILKLCILNSPLTVHRIDKLTDGLKVKLETAYKAYRGRKVNIISHSMAGLLVMCFLPLYGDDDERANEDDAQY